MVDGLYKRTVSLVEEKKHLIEALAHALLEKEVLNVEDIAEVLGERPFVSDGMRNIDKYRLGFLEESSPSSESSSPAEGEGDGGDGGDGGEGGVETDAPATPTMAATQAPVR
jgi:AFG3 family protein